MSERQSPETMVITSTDAEGYHIPLVEAHLDQPILIMDPTRITEGDNLSYDYRNGELAITYNGIPLDGIKGVWYRKPITVTESMMPLENPVHAKIAAYSTERFNNQLLSNFRDATWVSDPWAMKRAGNKTMQLDIAAKLGFRIPDTLITSSPEAAEAFVNSYDNVVVKSLINSAIVDNGQPLGFPTSHITKGKFSFTGLHLSPAIFQEEITPAEELRITVVGDEVFAASITDIAQEDSIIRDWRYAYGEGKTKFAQTTVSSDTQDLCRRYVRTLNLRYSAIDIIVDKQGREWFLESNSNGQWAFIEHDTNLPIGRAIARLLLTGSTR